MGHGSWSLNTQNAHNVPLYHVIPNSSMSTSFSTACPSASETVGLIGWSRVEHIGLF